MFDEYFTPPSIVVSPIQVVAAPRAVVLADSPVSAGVRTLDQYIRKCSAQFLGYKLVKLVSQKAKVHCHLEYRG
ncbi:hypothetical protein Tco_1250691 [Tanacetum coccineum]